MLVGCGITPVEVSAVKAFEVADTTTHAVKAEADLITSAGQAPQVWQASLAQGHSVVGRYEAQPLPNGEMAIKLKSEACRLSSDAPARVNEEVEATTAKVIHPTHSLIRETSLIVAAGKIPGNWRALLTQGHSVAGLYQIQPLPNGEVAIKLEKADVAGELSCQSM